MKIIIVLIATKPTTSGSKLFDCLRNTGMADATFLVWYGSLKTGRYYGLRKQYLPATFVMATWPEYKASFQTSTLRSMLL